ncbi:MAG: GAF domain-containing protein [Spirochaetota bacterium]
MNFIIIKINSEEQFNISKLNEAKEMQNNKKQVFEDILDKTKDIVKSSESKDKKLLKICELLDEKIDYYNWTGFYVVDENDKDMLNLSQYVGEKTEHTRIPFGKGICGQAAENKDTFVVPDVTQENNYLSCSINTKAEIVIPIFDNKGNIAGELDIDSHQINPFTEEDNIYLNKICEVLTPLFS